MLPGVRKERPQNKDVGVRSTQHLSDRMAWPPPCVDGLTPTARARMHKSIKKIPLLVVEAGIVGDVAPPISPRLHPLRLHSHPHDNVPRPTHANTSQLPTHRDGCNCVATTPMSPKHSLGASIGVGTAGCSGPVNFHTLFLSSYPPSSDESVLEGTFDSNRTENFLVTPTSSHEMTMDGAFKAQVVNVFETDSKFEPWLTKVKISGKGGGKKGRRDRAREAGDKVAQIQKTNDREIATPQAPCVRGQGRDLLEQRQALSRWGGAGHV